MIRRRGVALIMALLMVAIGTIVVAALIDEGQLALARTRNQVREQQAYHYARGLEAYAFEVLRRDQADGDRVDSAQDLWANGLPPMDIPGGRLAGRMRDLNGCLNINRLMAGEHIDAVQQQRWRRLLITLKLDPDLLDAIIDWIDADSVSLPRGAEDLSYLLLDPPYRAANQPMRHVSELRLVRGVDAAVFATLEPHVCAASANAPLNINTATVPVLMTLADGMSEAVARRIHNEGRARYPDVAALVNQLRQEGLEPGNTDDLAVHSTLFLAESMIELDTIELNYFSVIERAGAGTPLRVIARSRGVF